MVRNNGLTEKQQIFYDYLCDYVLTYNKPPLYSIAMKHFGYKSKRSISQYYEVLVDKGYINLDYYPIGYEMIKPNNEDRLKQFIIETIKEYEFQKTNDILEGKK